MSLPPDAHSSPALSPSKESVSWVSVAAVFGCFALFLFIIYLSYLPQREKTAEADLAQVSAEDRWQYSPDGRASRLAELHAHEQTELTTYGWIDQKAGVIRLPIDRSMELTVQALQAKK